MPISDKNRRFRSFFVWCIGKEIKGENLDFADKIADLTIFITNLYNYFEKSVEYPYKMLYNEIAKTIKKRFDHPMRCLGGQTKQVFYLDGRNEN